MIDPERQTFILSKGMRDYLLTLFVFLLIQCG